jgi:hypothetical protein
MDAASAAVDDLVSGKYNSLRQAAKANNNCPPSTARDRYRGRLPHGQEAIPHARLTRYQEDILAAYIRDLQLQYAPVNNIQLGIVAQAMARQNHPHARLGIHWISRFIKRRPELSNTRNKALAKERIVAAIPWQIEAWFQHLANVITRYDVNPRDIWNMDEIGFQMGHSQKENVVFDRRTGPPISITSGSTGWVTSVESISASGDVLQPLVLHRGTLPHQPFDSWFPPSKDCPNWFWGFTKKGWTNDTYGVTWIRDIFIPQTRRGRPEDDTSYWRILILDGHGSHATGEFIIEALQNQVLLVYLLPHTSHLCQPCDLGPFSQLKSFYSSNLRKFIAAGETQVSRADFNVLYHQTRQQGFQRKYIVAGWRRSGLFPLSPEKVLYLPEIMRYRQTTPDLAPPISINYNTPQKDIEHRRMTMALAAKLPREDRRILTALEHAYYRESNAHTALKIELGQARKRTRDDEDNATTKRLKEHQEKRVWQAKQVAMARGYTEEESDLLISVLPEISIIHDLKE